LRYKVHIFKDRVGRSGNGKMNSRQCFKDTIGEILDKVLKDSGKTEIGGLNSKRTEPVYGQCL